jgi:threonine/homoserine/homoserine lactone efflux protein
MTVSQIVRALARTGSFYAVLAGYLLVAILSAPLIERSIWFLVPLAILFGITFLIYLGWWMRRRQDPDDTQH